MKTIIIYRSDCGHTKRYVDSLKVRILADEVITYKEIKPKNLEEFDNIIYLGPLRNNVILSLDKLMKHHEKLKEKNFFIGACGISCRMMDDHTKSLIITTNDLDDKHVRLYFLPGGIDLKLMKPATRFVFKKALQMQAKKTEEPGAAVGIENLLKNGVDFTNPDHLDRMVTVINRIKDMEKK